MPAVRNDVIIISGGGGGAEKFLTAERLLQPIEISDRSRQVRGFFMIWAGLLLVSLVSEQ